MIRKLISTSFLILFLLISLNGCRQEQSQTVQKPELLIYCGITMARPIRELADLLEQRQQCTVKIILNGSGSLYKSIKINQVGDLYLPGSAPYLEKCIQEKLVSRVATLGINQAALIVLKGNPLSITANQSNLSNGKYHTVLSDPDTGSIGKESKRILTKAGLYEMANTQVYAITGDSKELTQYIISHRADLTINWRATTFWPENSILIEALPLPDEIAPPHQILMGILKYTTHPKLAGEFMDLASGPEGKKLFKAYGFQQ